MTSDPETQQPLEALGEENRHSSEGHSLSYAQDWHGDGEGDGPPTQQPLCAFGSEKRHSSDGHWPSYWQDWHGEGEGEGGIGVGVGAGGVGVGPGEGVGDGDGEPKMAVNLVKSTLPQPVSGSQPRAAEKPCWHDCSTLFSPWVTSLKEPVPAL